MSQSTANRNLIVEILALFINIPREIWKRSINIIKGVKDINPITAQEYIKNDGAVILDVREQSEYDAGHVPNSVFIPLGQLESRLAELNNYKNQKIVVICHGGKRSATACEILQKHQFNFAFNIAGGILAWKKQQLPVEI